jgi:hypothetical protein
MCYRITFCIDSVLKHCAANRKRRLSALPNVGPYIYDVIFSGVTRSSTYIHDISRLRVKVKLSVNKHSGNTFTVLTTQNSKTQL